MKYLLTLILLLNTLPGNCSQSFANSFANSYHPSNISYLPATYVTATRAEALQKCPTLPQMETELVRFKSSKRSLLRKTSGGLVHLVTGTIYQTTGINLFTCNSLEKRINRCNRKMIFPAVPIISNYTASIDPQQLQLQQNLKDVTNQQNLINTLRNDQFARDLNQQTQDLMRRNRY